MAATTKEEDNTEYMNVYEQFHLKLEVDDEVNKEKGEGGDNKENNNNKVSTEEEQPRQQQQQQPVGKKDGGNGKVNVEEKSRRQGRKYATKYADMPGGIRVDEMLYGLQMAHISCTDDSEERLKGSGANTLEALKIIVGSEEEIMRQPLTKLLKDQFDLQIDCWIDESGWLRGKPVDTQGFIASNDSTIVLSYRFSTSGLDWLTNISMWSSEWEPDRDELIGHAGWCSCFDGRVTRLFTNHGKPRVHTGFYNNFIYAIPHMRKHILENVLNQDETNSTQPKKIYIVGCSLGAAIATMSFCFLLEELEPHLSNPEFKGVDRLICVTAGSPKCCDNMMYDRIMSKLNKLRETDRVANCRLVYNCDVVPHIPFGSAYVHLDKGIYITSDGEVLVNPNMEPTSALSEFQYVYHNFRTNVKQAKSKVKQKTKDAGAKVKETRQKVKTKVQEQRRKMSTKVAGAGSGGGPSGGEGDKEEMKLNDDSKQDESKDTKEKQDGHEETTDEEENQIEGGQQQQQQPVSEEDGLSDENVVGVIAGVATLETTATMEGVENDGEGKEKEEKTAFEIECETTPQPIKDHMPYWYLTYLKQLKDKVDNGEV